MKGKEEEGEEGGGRGENEGKRGGRRAGNTFPLAKASLLNPLSKLTSS
jgi:hypothetical protein